VPLLVEVAVVVARLLTVRLWRDDRGLPGFAQWLDHPLVGIERLIGDESIGLYVRQQVIGADKIVRLAARQVEADRVTKSIDKRVDLGAQPTAGAADGLVFVVFFWAPALC
jgi:hypothetical protein